MRHRPFGIAGERHGLRFLVFAPQRSDRCLGSKVPMSRGGGVDVVPEEVAFAGCQGVAASRHVCETERLRVRSDALSHRIDVQPMNVDAKCAGSVMARACANACGPRPRTAGVIPTSGRLGRRMSVAPFRATSVTMLLSDAVALSTARRASLLPIQPSRSFPPP